MRAKSSRAKSCALGLPPASRVASQAIAPMGLLAMASSLAASALGCGNIVSTIFALKAQCSFCSPAVSTLAGSFIASVNTSSARSAQLSASYFAARYLLRAPTVS